MIIFIGIMYDYFFLGAILLIGMVPMPRKNVINIKWLASLILNY